MAHEKRCPGAWTCTAGAGNDHETVNNQMIADRGTGKKAAKSRASIFDRKLRAHFGHLLPRLASLSEVEVIKTVAALFCTLCRDGFDLHDLADRLNLPPAVPEARNLNTHVYASQRAVLHVVAKALNLYARVHCPPSQAELVRGASQLLGGSHKLKLNQVTWQNSRHRTHNQ